MRVLALALAIDCLWGELPAAVHPVVLMGKTLDLLERRAPTSDRARFAFGAAVALLAPLAWACLGHMSQAVLPWPAQAVVLKSAFAGRELAMAAERVRQALQAEDLPRARLALRALVSRSTEHLDASQAAAAAIESLAENYVDSWLAPLAAYVVGGLPAALAYRAVNTADAMWGYHNPRYEYLGKAAARLDDLLNWVPARLAVLLIWLVAEKRSDALRVWQADARRTPSHNAGQPMAVVAGAMGVRLEKVGQYVLNAAGPDPSARDIAAAQRLIGRAMLVAAALALAVRSRRG